jgi:hypothetical protein
VTINGQNNTALDKYLLEDTTVKPHPNIFTQDQAAASQISSKKES